MWSRLKRLFRKQASEQTASPYKEIIRFDAQGFTRTSELIVALKLQETWPWDSITEFGLHFAPALFADPWIGDYMEAEWFVQVQNEEGLERIFFAVDELDIDRLPAELLAHLPDIDLMSLRQGLKAAGGGLRAFKNEGEWVGWRRTSMCQKNSGQR